MRRTLLLWLLFALAPVQAQDAKTTGRVLKSPGGTELRVLVQAYRVNGDMRALKDGAISIQYAEPEVHRVDAAGLEDAKRMADNTTGFYVPPLNSDTPEEPQR